LRLAVAAALLLPGIGAAAGDAAGAQTRLTPDDIRRLPSIGAGTGTSGVNGIRTTVLAGDPSAAGPYTIVLRVPANTRIAAHMHRDERSAIVVAGTWHFGYGPAADDRALKALPAGSFYTEPAGVAHFARTGAQAVTVYISGVGPTDTVYTATPPRP
jgi:uncharacterized RmlC-like cupin family protein